jgi:predicted alpha/beta-hydrolase family hydrolase
MADPRRDIDVLVDGPQAAVSTIIFAHGAGQGMRSPFMEAFARGLGEAGCRIVRFEFPYMRAWRESGARRPPDAMPVLIQTWRQVLADLGRDEPPVIGGKSLGGRVASQLADEVGARGLVCLGYPFHPPQRPEETRLAHLRGLRTPTLIVQGARDAFGTPQEVAGYDLPATIEVAWIADGDHSYRPSAGSLRTWSQNLAEAVSKVGEFVRAL